MVKFRGFQGLTFKPQLYSKYLKKDLQSIKKDTIQEFNVDQLIQQGILQKQYQQCIYLYEQQYKQHISLGLLGQLSIKDYQYKNIKKHQETLNTADKKLNQDTIGEGHIAPVVVGYQNNQKIDTIIKEIQENRKSFAKWKTIDGRKHKLWRIKQYKQLTQIFNKEIQNLYILDGHHRFKAALQHLEKGQNINEKDKWIIGLTYQIKYIKAYPQYREIVDENNQQIIESILNNSQFICSQLKQFKDDQIKDTQIVLINNGKYYKINEAQKYQKQKQNYQQKLGVQIVNRMLENIKVAQNKKQQSERQNQNSRVTQRIKIQYIPSILIDVSNKQALSHRKYPILLVKAPSIQKIFQYGDKDQVLPPKSTWLQPKPCLHMVARFIQ